MAIKLDKIGATQAIGRILMGLTFCGLSLITLPGFCDVPATTDTQNTKKSSQQDLKPFNAVNLSGVGNLYIQQSNQENFTVEAPEDIFPLVVVYVKENTLFIDLKEASKHTDAKINYYLNVKNINSINSYSSSTIYIPQILTADTLTISISNLGEANLNLNVKKLNLSIDGGGKIVASGFAADQTMMVNAAGEINATKLSGKVATINIQGSGIVEVGASDKLTANIAGDGSIQYCGKPVITQQISGKGLVEALGSEKCP